MIMPKGQDGQIEPDGTWFYRAVLMSAVLKHLGYNTASIMNGDAEVLRGYIGREPEEIIHCLQMKGDKKENDVS